MQQEGDGHGYLVLRFTVALLLCVHLQHRHCHHSLHSVLFAWAPYGVLRTGMAGRHCLASSINSFGAPEGGMNGWIGIVVCFGTGLSWLGRAGLGCVRGREKAGIDFGMERHGMERIGQEVWVGKSEKR